MVAAHRNRLLNRSAIFLICNGFAGIQDSGLDRQTVTMTLFLVGLVREVPWSFLSAQPLSWSSYKIHFSSQVTIRPRIEKMALKNDDFLNLFSASSWGTHLLKGVTFFTFPIRFKYRATVEWSTLSSSANSNQSRRMAIAPHLQGSPSPLQNFLNHQCTVRC